MFKVSWTTFKKFFCLPRIPELYIHKISRNISSNNSIGESSVYSLLKYNLFYQFGRKYSMPTKKQQM